MSSKLDGRFGLSATLLGLVVTMIIAVSLKQDLAPIWVGIPVGIGFVWDVICAIKKKRKSN